MSAQTTAGGEARPPAASGYVSYGRCRSGKRWFWFAASFAYYGTAGRHCDDPVCGPDATGHEYGWEDDEEAALTAMHAAAGRLGGKPLFTRDRRDIGRASRAAGVLKKINAVKRAARPARPGADSAAPVGYLYEPWSWRDDEGVGNLHSGIDRLQIVKETATRIYYDKTASWDRYDGVVTLGFVSREDLETDTRCRDLCPRDVPAGLVCGPHSRSFPHCIHWGVPWNERDRYHSRYGACAEACPAETPGRQCAEHGFTWDHCPHGDRPGECWRGLPAGEARLPGKGHYGGGHVFTTLSAAEQSLRGDHAEPEDLKALRKAAADAHPDRGGTSEAFIAAQKRYERAKAAAGRAAS